MPIGFPVQNYDEKPKFAPVLISKRHGKVLENLRVIKNYFNMNFYKWSFDESLKINRYGIPEPESKKLVYPDILLVPLVAFDNKLNRLGYGGGYYDRLIEKLSKKKKILKIGLALTSQKIKKVPTNKYDQKLDYIVTNKYILK